MKTRLVEGLKTALVKIQNSDVVVYCSTMIVISLVILFLFEKYDR